MSTSGSWITVEYIEDECRYGHYFEGDAIIDRMFGLITWYCDECQDEVTKFKEDYDDYDE